ncbi:MAG TPA: 4'-phosphopantetheinyl transferase superfamily protein [Pseudonocardiaceae bacterium]
MIADLLPAEIAAEEIVGSDPTAALLPEELELVARAVEKRRLEVTNVRTAARRALARIGVPAVPILRGNKGQPLWPAGVVGSMTHTAGYCAAAVADAGKIRSIGIDAEEHDQLPGGVLDAVSLPAERAMLQRLGTDLHWDRLLFSAKESVYKAWFPLTGRWLGFEDAHLTFDPDDGTFSARILIDGATTDGPPLTGLTGRYLVRDGYVLTAITVPLATSGSPW